MKVLVDPHVVAVPPTYSPKHKVTSYLDSMQTWLDAASYPFVRVFHSSNCTNQLIEIDRFPFPQQLRTLLSTSGVTGYDANTVFAFTQRLFGVWEDIEDIIPVRTITGKLDVTPTFLLDRLPGYLSEAFLGCLGRLVLQRSLGDLALSDVYIGSTDHNGHGRGDLSIIVTISNVKVDLDYSVLSSKSTQIDGKLTILLTLEDILKSVEWDTIWQYPSWAIRKAYYSTLQGSDRQTYPLGSHTFGHKFITTIASLGLGTKSGRMKSIYETCALIACNFAPQMAGINPRRLQHSIRVGDGAKGMRANISMERAGYRIHYWKCPDGYVEFSCVNIHNDKAIY